MTPSAINCPMAPPEGHYVSDDKEKRFIMIGEKDGHHLYRCSFCELTFISDFSLNDCLVLYNDPNYIKLILEEDDHFNDLGFLNPAFDFFSDDKKLNILDVGCGKGELVNQLRKCGHNACGIDPILTNSNESWLFQAEIFSYEPKKQFDMIIAYQVLEHLIQPRKAILQMLNLLKPEGVIFIHTDMEINRPDDFLRWKYVIPPWHCCYYRHRTFEVFKDEIKHEFKLKIIWKDSWSMIFCLDSENGSILQHLL